MYNNSDLSYKYNIIESSFEIESDFFNYFIDIDKYNNFAKENPNAHVHMFDFINESQKVFYSDVIKYIKKMSIGTYYIILNISQCYSKENKLFQHNYKIAEISHEDLMFILNDQLKDMQGEELCYMRNPSRVEYWDMMIFDATYKWCCAITHEDNTNGDRLCFIAKK